MVKETYVYEGLDDMRTVVNIVRKAVEGRKFFGIDFWYSGFYLTGRFSLPDLYELKVIPLFLYMFVSII